MQLKKIYFFIWLAGIILLSGIRSEPIYGKLDFILLNPCPWWETWGPMIDRIVRHPEKKLYTDSLTSNLLNAVFNQPTVKPYQWPFYGSSIDIEKLEQEKANNDVQCVINLHGFPPSWVSAETHHWHIHASQTMRYYHYNNKRGKALIKYLKQYPPVYCDVYF